MMECNNCGATFSKENAIHEAELAWYNGEPKGDYVCPECGADDSQIEYIIDDSDDAEDSEHHSVTRHPIQVAWVNCNEGYSGDYDPNDPEDENLLRLDVSRYDSETEEYEVAESVCTWFPANAPWEIRQKALDALSYLFWEDHNSPGGSNLRMLIGVASYIDPDNIQMIVDKTKELRIRRKAYERFQLYWLATHGFSVQNLLKVCQEWAKELIDEMLSPDEFTLSAYIDERGFGQGSMYPCFQEFLGAEFCIEDLMKLLLDEEQFSVWEKDPIVLAHKDTDPALIHNTEN